MLHNVAHDDQVGSPFAHRHSGDAFIGTPILFGALVHAMPSALHKKRNLKFQAVLLQDGGKRFCESLRAFVEDLADKPVWSRSMWEESRVAVHSGRELRFDPKQPLECPCTSLYRCDNNTADGVQRFIEEQARAEALELDDYADADGSRADSSDAPPPGDSRDEEGVLVGD